MVTRFAGRTVASPSIAGFVVHALAFSSPFVLTDVSKRWSVPFPETDSVSQASDLKTLRRCPCRVHLDRGTRASGIRRAPGAQPHLLLLALAQVLHVEIARIFQLGGQERPLD